MYVIRAHITGTVNPSYATNNVADLGPFTARHAFYSKHIATIFAGQILKAHPEVTDCMVVEELVHSILSRD